MKAQSIFDFMDYKPYLLWREQNWQGRGMRRDLAAGIGCQPAYISQVFNSGNHLSLEQAEKANATLHHTDQEAHFFMLLVQRERAGTNSLQTYFTKQIKKIQEERLNLKERLQIKEGMSKEEQVAYYSSHIYALIHIALTVEAFQTIEALAERLSLPETKVKEVLEFLVECKLAVKKKGHFEIGTARIHIGNDSKLVSKHHSNWRVKVLENLDLATEEDSHYSSVVSCSAQDVPMIRERLLKAIDDIKKIIKDSPAEDLYVFNADFFRLKK